ncbi:hypothetical protein H0H92_000304, partial [Tricholoma furcatifolium]
MSDSEEGSEAEWKGWMADLHRQRQVQEENAKARRKAAEEEAKLMARRRQDRVGNEWDMDYDQRIPAPSDGASILDRRAKLEPQAVITVHRSTPSRTLYSPSSSDSLHRRPTRFSAADRSSSPAGTSLSGHGLSQPTSPYSRKHALPPGASLFHSASMNPIANTPEQNANLRRPSMPILTTEQTFSLQHN